MAKVFRGDTLPVMVKYKNYEMDKGDKVTIGIFDENMQKKIEKTIEIQDKCSSIQIELSREETHDLLGKCIIEARLITRFNMESTIQTKINFKEDRLR